MKQTIFIHNAAVWGLNMSREPSRNFVFSLIYCRVTDVINTWTIFRPFAHFCFTLRSFKTARRALHLDINNGGR